MNTGKNSSIPHRRMTIMLLIPLLAFCGSGAATCEAQDSRQEKTVASEQEREIVNKLPEHLPIKIKFRNLEKVKDLANEDWLSDVEVEVTNTGTKPLYYVYMLLELPETEPWGPIVTFSLTYGRREFWLEEAVPEPDDIPIPPGESCVLTVGKKNRDGWKGLAAEEQIPEPRKVELVLQALKYGDKTGFYGTTGRAWPSPK